MACPHCESTDCAGIVWDSEHPGDPLYANLFCVSTGKAVTDKMLRNQVARRLEV